MSKYTVIILLLAVANLYGQQDPQYTQYMHNLNAVNPAYAGSKDNLSFALLYRSQWDGISGAPETATFFAHAPIGEKLGLGVSIITDEIGPVRETNTYVDISYTLELGGFHRIAFGLKAGATFHDIGLAGLDIIDTSDVFFQDINTTTPNIGAGFYYYTNTYYFSVSLPNILNSVHLDANGNKLGSEASHYFMTGGYVLQLLENTKLKPSFFIKSSFDAPISFDLNLNAQFFERFEIGASFRLKDSFSGLVNFAITENLRIGYAYDHVTSDIRRYAPASHEFLLIFDLNLPGRVSRSPRYF